jgi:NADPH:quinone reductase-like Zn-dependent oxidoreductase
VAVGAAVSRYRAVIDRRYPLDQGIEATRYVETEHKVGNVVLTVELLARRGPWLY